MLDVRALRHDLDGVAGNLARRGFVLDRRQFLELEARRKDVQVEVERLRQQRNERSKSIGRAKADGKDIEPLKAEGRKCARSWRILPEVGSDPRYPDLSLRDAEAVAWLDSRAGASR